MVTVLLAVGLTLPQASEEVAVIVCEEPATRAEVFQE